VPSLIGLKVEDAQRMLDLYKLTMGSVTEEVSEQPTGTIIAQDPTPGMVPEGTAVNIVTSKEGVKRVTVAIPLPEVNRTITIRARRTDDNQLLDEATLNPLEDIEGSPVWSPVLTGEDVDEEVLITTYIDGKRYIEYYVNFSKSTFRVGRDRSDAEEFQ
jgi:hypothetical protein